MFSLCFTIFSLCLSLFALGYNIYVGYKLKKIHKYQEAEIKKNLLKIKYRG